VPSRAYYPARPRGELALAFLFEGQAPFAAIARDRRIAQFECSLFDANEKPLSDIDAGSMFLDGPAMTPDPATGLLSVDQGERYRYRAILFPGLKWKTDVNKPFDIDLIASDYDHVVCHLRGSQMVGTISKAAIVASIARSRAGAVGSAASASGALR
jgi:hypothetical protein